MAASCHLPHGKVDWDALEGRLGMLVRNLSTMKVVHWVNVCESSGTSLPGLSRINGC